MLNRFRKLARSQSADVSNSRESIPNEDGMSNKEIKAPKNYPPCNRAFALRMMNPTAYSDNNISPLDQEIRPLVTRKIAKGASLARADSDGNSASFDDNTSDIDTATLSPASSLASFQDMELYDIDEDAHVDSSGFTLTRTKSMVDSFGRAVQNGVQRANGVSSNEYAMARSHTALEEAGAFKRNGLHRMTMPARVSTKVRLDAKEAVSPASTYKGEGKKVMQSSKVDVGRPASASRLELKALSRAQSVQDRSRVEPNAVQSRMMSKSRPSSSALSICQNESTDNKAKNLSSLRSQNGDIRCRTPDARAKMGDNKSARTGKAAPALVPPATVNHKPSVSDLSESDNSIILSDVDSYHVTSKPRCFASNGQSRHKTSSQAVRKDSPPDKRSYETSGEVCAENTQVSIDQRRSGLSSSPLPNGHATHSDQFIRQLADVCHTISEKHPGEFQILESLVDMQAAYEAKELQHSKTLRLLQEKIEDLEKRLERGERRKPPSMSAVILPLAKATNAFQKQLEVIMSMCDLAINEQGVSVGVQTDGEQISRGISMEAIAVAEQISRECLRRDASSVPSSRMEKMPSADR